MSIIAQNAVKINSVVQIILQFIYFAQCNNTIAMQNIYVIIKEILRNNTITKLKNCITNNKNQINGFELFDKKIT